MTVAKNVRIVATIAMAATLGGCMFPMGGRPVGPQFSVTFMTREPPEDRVEIVSRRPAEDQVWIIGHWSARGNDYAWTKGRWATPESGRTEWENGRWEHEDRGWHYTEGHWR